MISPVSSWLILGRMKCGTGEEFVCLYYLLFRPVVKTPTTMATTVNPWAKIRPRIISWDCLVFPWWKARRPYISTPAVPKKPGKETACHKLVTEEDYEQGLKIKKIEKTHTGRGRLHSSEWYTEITYGFSTFILRVHILSRIEITNI